MWMNPLCGDGVVHVIGTVLRANLAFKSFRFVAGHGNLSDAGAAALAAHLRVLPRTTPQLTIDPSFNDKDDGYPIPFTRVAHRSGAVKVLGVIVPG